MTCDVKTSYILVLTSFLEGGRGHGEIVSKTRDEPFFFSISTPAVSWKPDFVDEFNATLQ